MKTTEILLTYPELSFIAEIDNETAKEIFQKELDLDKVSTKNICSVDRLSTHFGLVKSVDSRYDGENQLIFFLEHKANNYKKYLSDKPSIKNKKITGGKAIFYKICSPEQIAHAEKCLEASFNFLYPKGLNPKSKNVEI